MHRSFNEFVQSGRREVKFVLSVFCSISKKQYLPNIFLRDVIGLATSVERKIQIAVNQERKGENIILFPIMI